MKKFIKQGSALVAAAILLAGCGEEMVPLTESEAMVIVNYSAGTLAKHNRHQQEGMAAVYPKEEEEEVIPEEEEAKKPEEQEKQEENGGQQSSSGENEASGSEKPAPEAVTLTEALAIPGLEFSYKDYSVSNTYKQGDYFSLDAKEGNTYVILNVNIANTGSETVNCDLLLKQPIFTLKINEEPGVKNEVSMLENDVSTYIGAVEGGQTVAGILIFEVPAASAENISSLQLTLQMNETTTEINMK